MLPNQEEAQLPKLSYLNSEYGLKSWLLTGDHKRIAMLYLISITFFFFIGGAFAGLIRLELLTPLPDLVLGYLQQALYHARRDHDLPIPGALGAGNRWELRHPHHGRGQGPSLSQDQSTELVPVCCRRLFPGLRVAQRWR
jgi:hypothetical protein